MAKPRRHVESTLLSIAIAGLVAGGGTAGAQVPPLPSTIDCGPLVVNVNDFVSVNVGNADRSSGLPTVALVRLLDREGEPLLERRLTLAAGQSNSVSWRVASRDARQLLVRGEVVVETGPDSPQLRGTVQVFRPGLTYGPNLVCSGDTGGRGPV